LQLKGAWRHHNENLPITAVRDIVKQSFSKLKLNQNVSQANYVWWNERLPNLAVISIKSETAKTYD